MDEKKVNDAIRASEIRYRRLFETAQDGILLVDAKTGQITDVNPFLMDMLGYNYEEIIGKKLWEIGFIEDAETAKRAFEELQENTYIRYEDMPLETRDGRSIEVEFISNVYMINDNKVIQCNIRDISARKMLERQREDFHAMITHDIKSPLSTIIGSAELLLTDEAFKLETEAKELVEAIDRSGQKILRLAESFLDLSRLQSGNITLNKSAVDVAGLLRVIYEDSKQGASQKGLELNLELPEERLVCVADKRYVEIAATNMVENAIKYTSTGSVTLKADRRHDLAGEPIVISVSDTGPGIPEEHLGKIFNKYYRSSGTAGAKGTGLGLAIVKEVAAIHGGKVEVDCPEYGGCIFKLILPAVS